MARLNRTVAKEQLLNKLTRRAAKILASTDLDKARRPNFGNLQIDRWVVSRNKQDVNIHGPKMLERLARESGLKDFIHISALNVTEMPKRLFMPR